mmetsp:Transcript_11894/g.20057  ORF Transcript_11894/g.20057 Transcript_11894/m.20057 type:complete len:128 (+) Transcript_11894:320-703(+)
MGVRKTSWWQKLVANVSRMKGLELLHIHAILPAATNAAALRSAAGDVARMDAHLLCGARTPAVQQRAVVVSNGFSSITQSPGTQAWGRQRHARVWRRSFLRPVALVVLLPPSCKPSKAMRAPMRGRP